MSSSAGRYGQGGSSGSSSGAGRPLSGAVDPRAAKRARPDAAASSSTSASGSAGPSSRSAVPPPRPINPNTPPMLRVGRTTPQPVFDRNKALQTIYTQFKKLYAGILKDHPNLAHESALAQEAETSAKTSNLKAYKLAAHQAAVSIMRRPPPDRVPHSSIGTVKECLAAQEAEQRAKDSKLTPENMAELCIPVEEMTEWGYPDLNDPEIQSKTPRSTRESAVGERRDCDRCKVEFMVVKDNAPTHCIYHHGRVAPQGIGASRQWLFGCCGKGRNEPGCEEGVHVVSDKDDDKKLAEVHAFMTTEDVVSNKKSDTVADVVAMDCEMIYTNAGSSLARVSMVGEDGKPLLDICVRQTVPVLDMNTRFSGITQADLDSAVMDLPQAREAVCAFIGPNTVLVGHGLENDLRALRLLHRRVIDTAVIYPHPKGRPYRRALRDLVKENLGYFIQEGADVAGHSSLEDARATMELLKFKILRDNT